MKLQTKFTLLSALVFTMAALSAGLSYQAFRGERARAAAFAAASRHARAERGYEASRAAFYALLVSLRTSDLEREGEARRALDRLTAGMEVSLKENVEEAASERVRGRFRSARRASDEYLRLLRKTARESDEFKKGAQDIRLLEEAYAALGRELGKASDMLEAWTLDADETVRRVGMMQQAALTALLLCAGALPLMMMQQLFRPLARLLSLYKTMEEDDVSLPVPYTGRADEAGETASVIAAYAVASGKLREGGREQRKREEEAARRRKEEAEATAALFERCVKGDAEALGEAAAELARAAEHLAGLSGASDAALAEASEGARAAFDRVRASAVAAEEMAVTVQQISAQIRRSGEFIASSVLQVGSADAYAADLKRASAKMGDVTDLISEVASRINGLALNATIESARAGEAGRGFVAVANEVRNLAVQTDQSARDVAAVIAEMNRAADGMSFALGAVRESADKIHISSGEILSVVGGQSRAVEEVVRGMQAAALGAETVCRRLDGLRALSGEVRGASAGAVESAGRFNDKTRALSVAAAEFLEKARA